MGEGFTASLVSGRISGVGSVGIKAFGVASAGGFFMGGVGHFGTLRNQLEGMEHHRRSASAHNAAFMLSPRPEWPVRCAWRATPLPVRGFRLQTCQPPAPPQ
jgi:hypothetical protein